MIRCQGGHLNSKTKRALIGWWHFEPLNQLAVKCDDVANGAWYQLKTQATLPLLQPTKYTLNTCANCSVINKNLAQIRSSSVGVVHVWLTAVTMQQ